MIRLGHPTQNLRYLALENDERVWTVDEIVMKGARDRRDSQSVGRPHDLNPGGVTAHMEPQGTLHVSSQDPAKQAGAPTPRRAGTGTLCSAAGRLT